MVAETLENAIQDWVAAIGAENVVCDGDRLEAAATATFRTSQTVPSILLPSSREEVQACVRIAARAGVPLYPVSGGRNWGYGSRVPAASGCAILDLRRLNRIVDFSEELAYVTVEPGVTQRQLIEFLAQRNSSLWMDATGASPEASVLGNTVERGFGHTPYSDHFAHACGLEVVLPSGEVLETGFARFDNAKTAPLYGYGFGPVLDGLFSQSGLGIVTRMSVWLMPRPVYFQAFFFTANRHEELASVVDALRPLRLDGTLRSAVHIGNDYKVLSGLRQYPWEETGGRTPLTPDALAPFRKQLNFGAWSGSGALYGSKSQVAGARRALRQVLRGRVARLTFLDDRMLGLAGRLAGPFQALTGWDLSRTLDLVKPLIGLQKGVPTDQPLKSCYWRKRGPIPAPMDPDRDRCGLLWFAPVLPTRGADATRASDLAGEIVLRHGFEPALSLTLLTERAIGCVISIGYDRDVPGEDDRAMACHDELVGRFADEGYYPYRLGIQSMGLMQRPNSYNRLLQAIYQTVDPAGILAPGRYRP